jgi:pimeloyl-ACP methyl ester carboxylesterase
MDVLVQQDIPIQLNLVSQVTGRPGEIIFIGHSMGATLIFMHGAEFPQENQNLIQGIVALAPVTYLHGVPLMELAAPFFFILSVSNKISQYYWK